MIMKKIFLALAALASLSAVSCVKDEQNPSALIPEEKPEPAVTLCINELDPNNKKIELYNFGTEEISLKGCYMTKDGADKWELPDVKLAAGALVVYTAKSTDPADGPGFGMSATKGFVLELFNKKEETLDKVDNSKGSDNFFTFEEDVEVVQTLGRKVDGSAEWVIFRPGTIGSSNAAGTVEQAWGAEQEPAPVKVAKVVLNELCGNKVEYVGFESKNKFIELYNAGEAEGDLSNWTLRKYAPDAVTVAGQYDICWTAPAGTKIGVGAYLVLGADQTDPALGFSAGLSAKKGVKFELVNAEGVVVDKFVRGTDTTPFDEISLGGTKEHTDASFSRVPNGTGDWKYAAPSPGVENGESMGEIEHE